MRTVTENRHGITPVHNTTEYKHLSQDTPNTRSSFYDFGARQQMKFVDNPDYKESTFIESLMDEFLR